MEIIKTKYKSEFFNFEKQKENIRRLWNIPEQTAKLLYQLIIAKSPQNILEIGTSNGYSTFWISLAATKCNAKITSIEVDEKRYQMAKKNLINRKNISQILGKAEEIIPTLNVKFDFIFIDAGKIDYLNYLQLLEIKLNNGAFIVADNIISHQETVKKYLDYINSNSNYESATYDIDSGLEISIYSAHKE